MWSIFIPLTVSVNDTMAYIFGSLFGKTPLIKLSPNKTLEGFIGGASMAIIASFLFSKLLSFPSNICMNYKFDYLPFEPITCNDYETTIFDIVEWPFGIKESQFTMICLVYGTFASLISPFAGFLASGMKRAYNIKDFASTLPGHGGYLDRFDCIIFS
jgi:phosphatidate cytidylyltransferase